MKTVLCAALAAAFLTPTAAIAQVVISYTTNGGGGPTAFNEQCLPTAVSPIYAVSRGVYAGPARAWSGHPLGACALDNTTGIMYATDGVTNISRTYYPHVGCGPVPPPLAPLLLPAAVAQVTGMAVHPGTKNLYLTDGAQVFEFNPGMGLVAVWAPPMGSPLPLTGLDFTTWGGGFIFSVSANATVMTFTPAGAFVAAVAPAYAIAGLGIATGVALDNSVPAAPLPYILHAGGSIYHHATGALLAAGPANHQGLAFAASTQHMPGFGGCPAGAHLARSNSQSFGGNAAFALQVCGVPAGTLAAICMLDVAAPACVAGLGTLWTVPPFILSGLGGIVGTSASLPFPLPLWAVGMALDAQWVLVSPALALTLSNGVHVEVAIP